VMAYLWAAFPFTLFVLCSNSNDSLVALLLVACLLVIRSAPARGVMAGFAGLTKFAPLALAPLFLRGTGDFPRRRSIVWYCLAWTLAVVVPMLPVVLSGDLHWFWHDSISYQAGRPAPFSIWGLWGGAGQSLRIPEHIWQGVVVAFGVVVIWLPRGRREVVEVAALGAAILIGLQMGITYWFYLYIVWFFPLVVVALTAAHPAAPGTERGPVARARARREAAATVASA